MIEAKINWPVPEEFPVLRSREIHLWCAWLGGPGGGDLAGTGGLSADEIARAGSFHFAPDRHRFVAARLNLRRVLAGYVGRDPATLAFSYGHVGKPTLTTGNLAFNQSHAGSLWLLAVAWNQPLGVDVEEVKDLSDLALLESSFFSPAEQARQQSLPAAERRFAFFHRWTQREAAAKFTGLGLEPSAPFVPPDQAESFTPAAGFVGSLAYGGAPVPIRQFGWNARLLRPARPEAANPTPGWSSSFGQRMASVGLN